MGGINRSNFHPVYLIVYLKMFSLGSLRALRCILVKEGYERIYR